MWNLGIVLSLVVLALIQPAAFGQQSAVEPTDLTAYIAQIRQSGMSEGAQSDLLSVADIRTGATILEFIKDTVSGMYGTRYSGTLCAPPNGDKAAFEKLKQEMQAKTERELKALQPIADADASGFVSTAEGSDFRDLIEFGYKAAFVLDHEGRDLGRTCKALMMSQNDFEKRLARYRMLEARVKKAGLQRLPAIKL